MFKKIWKRLGNIFSRNKVPSTLTFDDPTVWNELKYLNLSNCEIATLPKELGALPHLEKLVLSNNGFGTSDKFEWHWLQQTAIQNNLRFLDLSKNSLIELPACIGKLSALTELIVCHNSLTCLPKELGALPHLEKLVLSNNGFGASDKFKWHWLQQTAIQNNLRFLDLSKNSLIELPACIGELSALTELIVCDNSLTCLPQSIGNLRNLQVLILSNNKLSYLPGSIIKSMKKYGVQLKILDVSKNAFFTFNATVIHAPLLSLRSLAAEVILKNRLTYRDRNITSVCLEYLEKALYCVWCDNPIFESHIRKFLRFNPLWFDDGMAMIWDGEENHNLPFECFFCWPPCCEYLMIYNRLMQ